MAKDKFSLSISRFLISIIIVILTILFFGSYFIKYNFSDTKKIAENVVDENYMTETMKYTEINLKSECMFLNIPYDEISKGLNKDEIKELSINQVESILSMVLNGQEMKNVEYTSDHFSKIVSDYLTQYESQNDVKLDESVFTDIPKDLSGIVTDSINISSEDTFNNKIFQNPRIKSSISLASNMFYVICGFLAIFILLLLFIGRKKILSSINNIITAIWVGVTLIFIPTLMIKMYNFPDKLILEESSLKVLVNNFINMLINSIYGMLMTLFIVFFVAIIIISYIKANNQYKIVNREKIIES